MKSSFPFLHSFLRWHAQGETPLFAADLARKVADGHMAPPAEHNSAHSAREMTA